LYHVIIGAPFVAASARAPWLALLGLPAAYGFSGVYLFFVISGFCIHLSWARARAQNQSSAIAFVPFWKRRIRRLYPPYLVALALYVLLLWSEGTSPPAWDIGLHLVMLHNLSPATALSINGVFWTLAIEEQLYLAYFLLLALRTRLGWPLTLAITLGVRVAWFAVAYVAHRSYGVSIPVTEAATAHWFIWALGAWSVEARYGLASRPRWTSNPWLCCLLLVAAATLSPPPSWLSGFGNLAWLLVHPLWGLGFFVLVNRATMAEAAGDAARTRRIRWASAWSALRRIGVFSYSLYLTHELVLTQASRVLSRHLPENQAILWQLLLLTPLSVAFAWVFYRLFERPFMTHAPERIGSAPGRAIEQVGEAGGRR
jgi:peptidoglycan/LPS O-acetylase OafA/YrhL